MKQENKLILSDCDNCILAWEWYFDRWMTKHGFTKNIHNIYSIAESYELSQESAAQLIRMFNETVYAGSLPPLRDAVKYIRKLHEDFGCVIHVISSISGESEIAEARQANLRNIFGSSVFYKITCLDPDVSKLSVLSDYAESGALWVEDHVANYRLGNVAGLTPILMNHGYNAAETDVTRVHNWSDIYNRVATRFSLE